MRQTRGCRCEVDDSARMMGSGVDTVVRCRRGLLPSRRDVAYCHRTKSWCMVIHSSYYSQQRRIK